MNARRSDVSAYIPELRRYARILTGSQTLGDWYVRMALYMITRNLTRWPRLEIELYGVRVALYRVFQEVWARRPSDGGVDVEDGGDQSQPDWGGTDGAASDHGQYALRSHVRALPDLDREVLLLTELCGFSVDETAWILGVTVEETKDGLASALAGLQMQTATTVLIIEDEPIIALDLNRIVVGMGHRVVGLAETKTNAVVLGLTQRPGVILADIQLRDGSSGLDAVHDILSHLQAPVIFVTAFPDRLLTGKRIEPTYLVTKPFDSEVLKLTINKALLLHAPPTYALNG